MNREIKFEYGFESVNGIVKKVYHLHEIPNIKEKCDVFNVLPIVYVRQYTGLKDKNGKEIYEGDIVQVNAVVTVFGEHGDYIFNEDEEVEQQIICKVVYRNEFAGFDLETIESDLHLKSWGFYNQEDGDQNEIEVFGNIHQALELLKNDQ